MFDHSRINQKFIKKFPPRYKPVTSLVLSHSSLKKKELKNSKMSDFFHGFKLSYSEFVSSVGFSILSKKSYNFIMINNNLS